MKLTKQDIDKVRHIEGFPIADDEDIIELSNPPYYTACPNPFIEDFIKEHGKPYDEETDNYKREPFAADVSEGKNDPIYNVHTYHTKVPHKAIMRYILHYTEPGDIVFDGFCGTGMTGVAAQLCGNPDYEFKIKLENEMGKLKWEARKAILNDLSPAATFIAHNYNSSIEVAEFEKAANEILDRCMKKYEWMYETNHVDENVNPVKDISGEIVKGKIIYTVWSDVFICPNCGNEIVFWEAAADKISGKVSDVFICESCRMQLKKKDCEKASVLAYDNELNQNVSTIKQVPVLIKYSYGKKKYEKRPDQNDLENIKLIESKQVYHFVPTDRMIEGKETRRNDKIGLTHVHHYYTKKTLLVLSEIYNEIQGSLKSKNLLKLMFTSQLINISKLNRYRPQVSFPYNPLSGTMYVSSMVSEANVFKAYSGKIKKFIQAMKNVYNENSIISCSSLTNTNIKSNSVDYIFTDPPFGSNLNYSELSFLWEAWLKVRTNNREEAIINSAQGKGLLEYQELMIKCFEEYYRVLKPNRWMTVEFSNSKNAVWNAIQEALNRAGFIVADVRTLDKQSGSFKQVTTTTAVKQDLVISAYKPKESFNKMILEHAGTQETVWDFIREHLDKLPIVVKKGQKIEPVREREAFLLFDRMIAYHVMEGIAVPLDATDFYKGLDERFLKRDNMYFLHDQINKYDDVRIVSEIEPIQFSFYVCDEKSAIAWLYQQLENPQTYGEIQPKFVQELRQEKHEKMPELMEILEENFLQDEKGKWYIPDVTKEGDLIKLREKRLLKEFEDYITGKGKLKLFRTEAVRVGFAKLWKNKDYQNIVKVANRLPDKVIQEDDKLLMYYDISLSRVE